MNSGEPLRSDGFAPPVIGGPLGWFRKLASGVIPNSLTMPGIAPGWSMGPPEREPLKRNAVINLSCLTRSSSVIYLAHWKAFLGVLGKTVSHADGRVDRRNRNQIYHLRSREIRVHRVRPETSSSENLASFSSRQRRVRDPCSWAAWVGALLIFCSGTRPVKFTRQQKQFKCHFHANSIFLGLDAQRLFL